MNNITLIGMPGSGKSTVGVLLAKALGFQFVDVDLLIQQREGALLQELLDNRGVEPFLDAEEAAICSLACTGAVIAPGGSAVCRAGAIGHLRALGRVVYLHVPLSELERRIHNITTRGIAMAPGQTLADVYAAREPLYRRYADLTVDVGGGERAGGDGSRRAPGPAGAQHRPGPGLSRAHLYFSKFVVYFRSTNIACEMPAGFPAGFAAFSPTSARWGMTRNRPPAQEGPKRCKGRTT